ncbi:N-acetyltransferase family protein [Dermacoccaceae bacterium W4C1]
MSEGTFVRYDIRPVVLDDGPELGRLHVQVWREAYTGLMPQQSLDDLDEDRSTAKWLALAREQAEGITDEQGKTTRVAVDAGGALVGFGTVGPARDEDPPLGTELWALNTLAAYHGTGAGAQLLVATLGLRPAYLWVLDGNERAIAFYRKHGFELDGERRHDDRHGADDLRMVRG